MTRDLAQARDASDQDRILRVPARRGRARPSSCSWRSMIRAVAAASVARGGAERDDAALRRRLRVPGGRGAPAGRPHQEAGQALERARVTAVGVGGLRMRVAYPRFACSRRGRGGECAFSRTSASRSTVDLAGSAVAGARPRRVVPGPADSGPATAERSPSPEPEEGRPCSIKISAISHAAIRVTDLARARGFYVDLLSFQSCSSRRARPRASRQRPPRDPRRRPDTRPDDRFDPHRVGLDHLSFTVATLDILERSETRAGRRRRGRTTGSRTKRR